MSFIDRGYTDVVRDLMTTLTQGVTQERHPVVYERNGGRPQPAKVVLARRPVRRVSFVSGFVVAPRAGDPPLPHVFTLNDYELVADSDDPRDLSTIRFLPFGRKPADGTVLTVNYYPRAAEATPITDLNVGSVARTLLETIGRELALLYTQVNAVYDSAFVETAAGSSLDRVVALLGCARFRAGRAVGTVTFSRRPGALGSITIPAGTPITDTADRIRYETAESRELLAGESTAQVRVRGASEATPPVPDGVLTVVQRAVAGIESVVNERPTTRASDDETDEDLRARARAALLGASKGTVDALRHGLLQLPEVRDVEVVEMPNGVPGEIKVVVSRADGRTGPPLPPSVVARLEELRPAGIRLVTEAAGSTALTARVALVLAGGAMPAPEVEQVRAGVRQTLAAEIGRKGVGEKIRLKPLVAALLRDPRVVDVELTLAPKGGPAGPAGVDVAVPAGTTVTLDRADIAFDTPTFEQAPPAGRTIRVEVRALVAAQPLAGITAETVRAALAKRLTELFGALTPGTALDLAAVLGALRDDASHAIDPLRSRVTLTSEQQFVQLLHGGAGFTVAPGQGFEVMDVELAP
jgi:uncharacterized phage protein gp47/JayE